MLKVLFFGQLKDVIKTEYLEIEIVQNDQSGQPINTVAMLFGMSIWHTAKR
jgi:molybdopterin synthase sulfur carrier subunit